MSGAGLLAAKEEHHAKEDKQRREPGEIERQNTRHQRRTHIGPQDNHQRGRQPHQILSDKRSDQQRGGIAALHQCGYANAGDKGHRLSGDAAAEHAA